MSTLRGIGPSVAALVTGLLLLVPLVVAILPRFTNNGFPGPYTRTEAVLTFFILVPLLFVVLVAYHVARYHGLVGEKQDPF